MNARRAREKKHKSTRRDSKKRAKKDVGGIERWAAKDIDGGLSDSGSSYSYSYSTDY